MLVHIPEIDPTLDPQIRHEQGLREPQPFDLMLERLILHARFSSEQSPDLAIAFGQSTVECHSQARWTPQ